ncbi:MAG: glycosyl hydrolase family 18 protein [Firmicutes bacterium]|nr:glycosyl hydrolase family 18 protein [Bacillota bacterium]
MRFSPRTSANALVAVTALFFLSLAAGALTSYALYGNAPGAQAALAPRIVAQGLSQIALGEPQRHARLWKRTLLSFVSLALAEFEIPPIASAAEQTCASAPSAPTATTRHAHQLTAQSATAAIIRAAGAATPPNRRLTIGWALNTGAANLIDLLSSSPGLNVLAPKWITVDGPLGQLSVGIEPQVVTRAHARHVAVWAVVDNMFDGPLTHDYLQYRDTQDMLIRRLVRIAVDDHLNGLNLDFEGLLPADRWNYARFIDVLAQALHAHGMSLSVDLPPDVVPGDNSGPYNHAAIAAAANDIILMAYDEHWGGDAVAGPTAAVPWVQSGVDDMLETGVPADKLVLGVPFYTQEWTLGRDGQVQTSSALSLWQETALLAQVKAPVRWLHSLELHFIRYRVKGVTHEIWIEDTRSLLLSLQLVGEDGLAGAAAWYLGLERPSTWTSLVQSVHSELVPTAVVPR